MSLKDADVTETNCACGCLFTTEIDILGEKVVVHICKKDKQRIIDAINRRV